MATNVTGYGPFEFTSSTGKQISIPLSALTIVNNVLQSSDAAWNAYLSAAPAQALAKYLIKEGLIAPMPAPSPFPAMVLRAATPGTAGNNITVTATVSSAPASPDINDPMLIPFSIRLTETDTYANQTPAIVAATLANSGGLVKVVETVQTSGVPDSYTGSFSGSPDLISIEASGSPGGTLFVLGPKGSGADVLLTSVTVTPNLASPPNPGAGTFTLQVSWTKTVNDITLATLESTLQSELGYEITISKPSSGAYSIPASGVTTTFSGGSTSSNASATLFTGI